MASSRALFLFLVNISLLLAFSSAEDPFVPYNFEVSYITASPLGVPQQVPFSFFTSILLLFLDVGLFIFHMGSL